MNSFLAYFCVLLGLIVLIGFFNEKVTKLTYEIALLLFGIAAGCVITAVAAGARGTDVQAFLDEVRFFDLEKILLHGILCFMLFAGSCHIKLSGFRRHAGPVAVLSFGCTLVGAVLYGLLFYLVSLLLKLPFTLPMCLMFGSVIAPTDPIAATSILKQYGLSKNIGFLMEGESLLNDGVGVALFVCFSGMVTAEEGRNFFAVIFRELFGAVLIGTLVTLVCFWIFRHTKDEKRKIFVSLLAVALAYLLCERFDCSGAIASVVCGVLFSTLRGRDEEKAEKQTEKEREPEGEHGETALWLFDSFWDTLDTFLNSILYIILGLTFIRIIQMPQLILLSILAILLNLVCRFGSLWTCSFAIRPLPDGYSRMRFCVLFTWGGLRGGLSVALAMSTAAMIGTDAYRIILGCTYAVVFFTTVVQGLTMKKVYQRL